MMNSSLSNLYNRKSWNFYFYIIHRFKIYSWKALLSVGDYGNFWSLVSVFPDKKQSIREMIPLNKPTYPSCSFPGIPETWTLSNTHSQREAFPLLWKFYFFVLIRKRENFHNCVEWKASKFECTWGAVCWEKESSETTLHRLRPDTVRTHRRSVKFPCAFSWTFRWIPWKFPSSRTLLYMWRWFPSA